MVINKNSKKQSLDLSRFAEMLNGYSAGKDIISGKEIILEEVLPLIPMAPMIIELRK